MAIPIASSFRSLWIRSATLSIFSAANCQKQIQETLWNKMKHYKIPKLLDNSSVSKFVKIECIYVNDLSGGQYSVNK